MEKIKIEEITSDRVIFEEGIEMTIEDFIWFYNGMLDLLFDSVPDSDEQ